MRIEIPYLPIYTIEGKLVHAIPILDRDTVVELPNQIIYNDNVEWSRKTISSAELSNIMWQRLFSKCEYYTVHNIEYVLVNETED